MVLLNILKHNKINCVAIHIEYCNRVEAKLEREFLEHYCYKNNIKLYYRTINYIDRSNRELFEKETRKARFNLYKYVIEKENLEGICLGHHSGDIVENVFTNIIKGCNINDLVVMEELTVQNNINIFRPLLKFKKHELLLIAHTQNIPYFLNSTPEWSCRGILRDKIIPILKSQFGNFEDNIIKFTESCRDYHYKCNYTKIESEYYTKIEYSDNIDKKSIELIILDIMHSNGYNMVSHKLMNNYIIWLKGTKCNQIDLGKNIFSYYKNNYLYFINYTKIINKKPDINILIKDLSYLPPKIKKLLHFNF